MPDATKTHIQSGIAARPASSGDADDGAMVGGRRREREWKTERESVNERQRGAGTNFMLLHISSHTNFLLHLPSAPASTSASRPHICVHLRWCSPSTPGEEASSTHPTSDTWISQGAAGRGARMLLTNLSLQRREKSGSDETSWQQLQFPASIFR